MVTFLTVFDRLQLLLRQVYIGLFAIFFHFSRAFKTRNLLVLKSLENLDAGEVKNASFFIKMLSYKKEAFTRLFRSKNFCHKHILSFPAYSSQFLHPSG